MESGNGASSDRTACKSSPVYTQPSEFLSDGEVGIGDGNYRGEARANAGGAMCVPFRNSSTLTEVLQLRTAQNQRGGGNTIGQIKKWIAVGRGWFRHAKDFKATGFEVSSKLTAGFVRVRDYYPRSLQQWTGAVRELRGEAWGLHVVRLPGSRIVPLAEPRRRPCL